MKILLATGGDVQVYLAFEDTEKIEDVELFDYLKEEELFKASLGETYTVLNNDGKHKVLLGLGKKEELNHEKIREAFFKLGKELTKVKAKSAEVAWEKIDGLCIKKSTMSLVEGLIHSQYSFEKYLSEKKTKLTLENFYINLVAEDKEAIEKAIEDAEIIMEGVFLARDLVNEPAIVMTPTKLAETAKEELEDLGVKMTVLGRKEIEDLNMEAFLAVAEGSDEEPKFLVMEWEGNKDSDEKIALVGKGLTYDTGGYSLKPSNSMDTMFTDMAGAASVIGVLKSLAKSKVEKNVVGVVAACENAIDGSAYKPGDIIGSMSGKTIEVGNTDAEGRLTLADALWYASTVVKADKIIDIATLTGACVVALSDVATGAVTNNKELMAEVEKAAKRAGEYVWELPAYDIFKERIKSERADLINTANGPMGAGTITAGLFLGEFVNDTPWLHLDIAGTSYISTPRTYLTKGATGIPVNTLYNFVKFE